LEKNINMKQELLQLPATISKVSSMANKVLRLQIDTNENLSEEQMAKIMSKYDKFGYFCFLEDTRIKEDDVIDLPPLPKDEADQKSPSQRLRARMFVYYKETHTEDKFNEWYADTLNKIGEQYLQKLDAPIE